MKIKLLLCYIISLCFVFSTFAQEKRLTIKEYLNREILMYNNFAGESITLIKENSDYFILRKFFGSGVPVISSVKYKVIFNSNYQIAFTEIIDSTGKNLVTDNKEYFLLCVEEKGLCLYLNQLKVLINENFLQKAK